MKKSFLHTGLIITLAGGLFACQGDGGSTTSTPQKMNLNTYKGMLTYAKSTAPALAKNLAAAKSESTGQLSFVVSGESSLFLSSVIVHYYKDTDTQTTYNRCESEFIVSSTVMGTVAEDKNEVEFNPGTYTSTDTANYNLCGEYTNSTTGQSGCPGLIRDFDAGNVDAVSFEYHYTGKSGGGSYAICLNKNNAANGTETIANWSPQTLSIAVSCTLNSYCGFSQDYSITLPYQWRPILVMTNKQWDGNLGGFSGADAKCMTDDNVKASQGFRSPWKALISKEGGSNNATEVGLTYYRSDLTTRIATATNGNLVGKNSLENSISTIDPSPLVEGLAWTGAYGGTAIANQTDCFAWTNNDSGYRAVIGVGVKNSDEWWLFPIVLAHETTCSDSRRLYCVQQREIGGALPVVTVMDVQHKTNGDVVIIPESNGFKIPQGSALRTLPTATGVATYELVMQTDGNLVYYKCSDKECTYGKSVWSSNTTNGSYAIFQSDGNLVVYNSTPGVSWGASTDGSKSFAVPLANPYLQLQDDGNLVIYKSTSTEYTDNTAVWAIK